MQDALEKRYKELDATTIKLTQDQRYLCRVMGVPLPFQPFSGEKEFKAYAKFVIENNAGKDDVAAAVEWCKHVDGIDVLPKLPSHLRTHREEWDRNQRVKECAGRAKEKNERLEELNRKTSPSDGNSLITSLPETTQPTIQPDQQNGQDDTPQPIEKNSASVQTAAQTLMMQLQWTNQLMAAARFPVPHPQAFVHNSRTMVVGGVAVSPAVCSDPAVPPQQTKRRGPKAGSKYTKKGTILRQCGRCNDHGGLNKYICRGRGRPGRDGCQYYNVDGTAK